jgi:signal transduction histidine kinase
VKTTTERAFDALSEAVLAVSGGELAVDPVLQRLAQAAQRLVGARYAAIGVPDGEGGFTKFIAEGMTQAQWDALGEVPRTHGLLGAMLETSEPFRTDDIQADPRFEGWPDEHPNMRSFLGVPIVSHGETVGAFYLTEKKGQRHGLFTAEDERLIITLAAHAALALERAELYERSRELSTIEERKRLARELHDSVTQTLFSITLTAEAAAALVDGNPSRARGELERLQELAQGAMTEMRSIVFELRPAELETEGLAETLRKHVEVLRRLHACEIEVRVEGEPDPSPAVEKALLRIGQEALANAVRHSGAQHVTVQLSSGAAGLALTVADDGDGFDPEEALARSRRLGLTSMRERAEALGGSFDIRSEPGAGTTIAVEVPHDPRPRR